MPNQSTISELLVDAAARIEAMASLLGTAAAHQPFIKELLTTHSSSQRGINACGVKHCPAIINSGEHKRNFQNPRAGNNMTHKALTQKEALETIKEGLMTALNNNPVGTSEEQLRHSMEMLLGLSTRMTNANRRKFVIKNQKKRTIFELPVEAAARIEAMASLLGVSEAQKPFVKELLEASSALQRARDSVWT